jgi:hypothetical protein
MTETPLSPATLQRPPAPYHHTSPPCCEHNITSVKPNITLPIFIIITGFLAILQTVTSFETVLNYWIQLRNKDGGQKVPKISHLRMKKNRRREIKCKKCNNHHHSHHLTTIIITTITTTTSHWELPSQAENTRSVHKCICCPSSMKYNEVPQINSNSSPLTVFVLFLRSY